MSWRDKLGPEQSKPEYWVYRFMRDRCLNPRKRSYQYYGGRGICLLYQSFSEFFADVGPRPSPKHSIDRIDTSGHYQPGNCRWALITEQNRNRRSNTLTPEMVRLIRKLKSDGLGKTVIAKRLNRAVGTVNSVMCGYSWKDIE